MCEVRPAADGEIIPEVFFLVAEVSGGGGGAGTGL